MTTCDGALGNRYVIPSQTIDGSAEAMLAQIDEAVRGLLALRHLIAVRHASRTVASAGHARAGLRLVPLDVQSASTNR
jgi:hypothetical protein